MYNMLELISKRLSYAFLICLSICIFGSIYFETPLLLIIPVAIISLSLIYDDFRKLFFFIFAVLPFSIEVYFDNLGIGTDIPSEPLMIVLTLLICLYVITNGLRINKYYVFNTLFLALLAHVFWIFITSINSTYPILSFKFFIAKIWYVLPFLLFPLIILKDVSKLSKAYRITYKFLFFAILIVLVRHTLEGFSFASSYDVVRPFFRNHVTYASISVICLPFIWAQLRISIKQQENIVFLFLMFIVYVIGIYFSYTRAAILSIFIATGAWFIIQYKLVVHALVLSGLLATMTIVYLSWDNNYMHFAPDYEKTITHTEFDNLLEATYKLEDISSMERVYRWMAGIEMIKDKFWLGFGPSTFYSNYKSYSISRFQTYVSDNPDQSGIHNYFLMTWVEQGFIGFLILMFICFYVLIYGERVYHQSTGLRDKYLAMASILSLIIIFAMSLINDLLETDKVGPFFFVNIAILLMLGQKYDVKLRSK